MKSHILWVAFWVIGLLQTPVWGSETSAAELDVKRQGHVGFTNRDSWPKGEAALTFDDGPHPSFTPKVLDLLAKHGMKATFFLVGQNITDKTYPLVQRMIREGHAIGSHSYSHDVKMALSESRDTVSYIRGQHEATQVLVDLAMLADSAASFNEFYVRVFEQKANRHLTRDVLSRDWPNFVKRHEELLRTLGIESGQHPYAIAFTRPPGGGPYVGACNEQARLRYNLALGQLGWVNVLWHNGVWDPNPERLKDYDFVVGALTSQARRGGILVIHDYVRTDALAFALGKIAADKRVKTVLLEPAVVRKYGNATQTVIATLQQKKNRSNVQLAAVERAPSATGTRATPVPVPTTRSSDEKG
jgi:peptidoglycan/xylan/chitin deacetylase (PgdA/CDA1 family)